jgi:gliding motility-associatede transport system auxiliary component
MERKQKASVFSGATLVLIAVALVLVNVLAYAWNKRFDVTKSERFTLSKGSGHLVHEGLKEQLTVTLYVTRGLPKTTLFVDDLINLMSEYEQASGGKLHYVVIEPKTEEEKTKAKDAGLQELALGEGSDTGDQTTIAQGFLGMVFEYGSEKEVIPVLSPDNTTGLEFWITNKIREIRDRAEDNYQKVGVITHEGIKLADTTLVPPQGGRPGPSITGVLEQALPFYKIEDVDLAKGDSPIPTELRGVIVLQSDEDWTEKELARIDEFLMLGDKSLLIVAGAVNMKSADAGMKATLDLRGLEQLTNGYGIEMKKDVVVDYKQQMRITLQNQMGRMDVVQAPGVLQIQTEEDADPAEQTLDSAFAGFFRLDELAFPYASTLVGHPDKQPKAEMKVVARSSDKSTAEEGESVDLSLRSDSRPSGEEKRRDIAIVVDGTLQSAFAGKKIEGVDAIPAESKEPSRVLVIASPQFLTNPFARAGNPPPMPPQMQMMGMMGGDRFLQQLAWQYARQFLTPTILAFKNLLDWMANDKDLLAASAKLLGDPNLIYRDVPKPDIKPDDSDDVVKEKMEKHKLGRKSLQQRVQWIMTILPVLLFMGLGIGRWLWRESKRDSIKLDSGPSARPTAKSPAAKPSSKAGPDKKRARATA